MKLSTTPQSMAAIAVAAVLSGCSVSLSDKVQSVQRDGYLTLSQTPYSKTMINDQGFLEYRVPFPENLSYGEKVKKVIAYSPELETRRWLLYREEELEQDPYQPSAALVEMVGRLKAADLQSYQVPALRGPMPVEDFSLEDFGPFSIRGNYTYRQSNVY